MKIKLSENLCRPEDMKCLKETDETLYCIVAKTHDGKTKFYKDGAFVDDYTNCTTFNDLDEARAEWFDIDKSKYRRVFVPVYDPESFKAHLTESLESTRDIILEIVQGEFETGHNIADSKEEFFKIMKDEGIRPSTRMWDFYKECHDLGPSGFYAEYKDVLDFDPMFVSEYGAEDIDEGLKDARSNRQKLKAYFAAQGKTLNVEENLKKYEAEREQELGYKTCDNCGTRLNDGGTCPKCDDGEEDMDESLLKESRSVAVDEDTANEIAHMAMRAMRLKEHEAEALEYDLIEGNADKWIKDFEALPDTSDVKKLFFTHAVKTNEGLKESAELTDREKLQRYFDGDIFVEPKTMDAAARGSDVEDIDSASTDVADEVDTTVYVDKQGKEHKGNAAKVFRYLDSLEESKESETCCICKEPIKGYGNNAEPVCSGRCCDKCNMDVVLPARVKAFRNSKNEELDDDTDGMLTESYSDEMTNFMNWIQTYRNGALWDAFATEFEAEQDPDIATVLEWLETFDETAYYDYVAADTYDDDIDDYYANF